jgi:hypothetical protein
VIKVLTRQNEFKVELERYVGGLIYNIVPLKGISPLASPLSFKCEEEKLFTKEISEAVKCAKDIEETIRPLLERLRNIIFKRQEKGGIGINARTHKLVDIYNCNKEDGEEVVGSIWRILEALTKVGQTIESP